MSARARAIAVASALAPALARADVGTASAEPDPSPPCMHRPDVVGFGACPYGTWGANLREPYVFVDIGLTWRHFGAPPATPAIAARGDSPTVADTTTGGGGAGGAPGDGALELDERVGVGLPHGIFLAIDLELGNFAFDARASRGRDVVLVGTGAVGLRLALGPLALSGELAAGGMASSVADATAFTGAGVVDARGGAELWVSPWLTIGAKLGASVVRRDEWLAGAFVGFHTHAYGGDR